MKKHILILLSILIVQISHNLIFAYQISEIPKVVYGLRNNYNSWRSNLPLGDINRDGIGNALPTDRLIFSESISYCLFSHVLFITHGNEIEAKNNFLECWNWAKNNMVRKNISQVFNWETQTWKPMPQHLKDNLLAWRYVLNINNTGENGIIYAEQDDDSGKWHDGTQVATDGDLLTAYSLYLAYKRGWGNDLFSDAKNIINDIREKGIIDFSAGELYNSEFFKKPSNMFTGKFDEESLAGSFEELTDLADAYGWEGKNNFVGFYHDPLLDLSNLEKFEIVLKGNIGANSKLDVRLQDTEAVSGDTTQPGHVYMSPPIHLSDDFSTLTINKSSFTKNPDFGTQEGELDWSKVKNVQFQVSKQGLYDKYDGSYGDPPDMTMIDEPGTIAWEGRKNFVGFSYRDILDLSNLKSISVTLKGSGAADLRLEDEIEGYTTGHIYKTNIPLSDTYSTVTFYKEDFSKFLYSGLQDGTLNWDKIKKVQIQVDETFSIIYLQSIAIELNDGKKYIINDGTVESSRVYVKSIQAFLSDGQSDQNNGYKLLSNAHGALHINPSYFMPFAYRVFNEIDTEHFSLWNELIDETYSELFDCLEIILHDLNGNPVSGNGKLVPNWYMFDKLTGERIDVNTQKADSNVRGFEFGYDAFRTIWFIAYDYSLFKESRAMTFLQTILPFFQDEIESKAFFYPVYQIDGTPSELNESGAGFPSVYINLFNLCDDRDNEKKILEHLWGYLETVDNRAWFANPLNVSEGEDEYFMNFWAFFGLNLYKHNNIGDIDDNKTVDLRDAIAGLKILNDIAISDVFIGDVNGDNKIGIEDVIFILHLVSLK